MAMRMPECSFNVKGVLGCGKSGDGLLPLGEIHCIRRLQMNFRIFVAPLTGTCRVIDRIGLTDNHSQGVVYSRLAVEDRTHAYTK
jgi:hypothetical protein